MLGGGTSIAAALLAGATSHVAVHSLCVTVVYLLCCLILTKIKGNWTQKARFLSGYFFVLWYYLSAGMFVVDMELPVRDAQLLAADEALFGATPSTALYRFQTYWLSELMSGCYLLYLVYLHAAILYVCFIPDEKVQRFGNWLLSIFAIGLSGYLMFPASGPGFAFPELFKTPMPGGPITEFNGWVVASGSNRFDAFPSLHVLITSALLIFDYRYHPRRFTWMLAPSLGIFISTIYLRYHYLVDLFASMALLLVAISISSLSKDSDELHN